LLAGAERPDGSTAFDSSITSWMVAHRTGALTAIARLLSTIGSQTVLIPLLALVLVLMLIGRRRFASLPLLVVAWGGAIGLYSLAKHLVGRRRPPADLWLTKVSGKSFPSGHAVQSLSTYLALVLIGSLWLGRRRLAASMLAVVLALGVGWSRVYLGVHWTTDVLAGWLVAAAWTAFIVALARRV
jgi:undecaprenyl-diphosphatase